jgi:putative acetyltransferase
MHAAINVSPIEPGDFPQVVAVWEASVRATHHFVTEADIQFFKSLVLTGLPQMPELAGVRDENGQVVGFVGVAGDKVEMLFIHPAWRGRGVGRRLLTHAITRLGAVLVDVNEQNQQAVGFYRRMGFAVIGRSERDSTNKPFPLLHMRMSGDAAGSGG